MIYEKKVDPLVTQELNVASLCLDMGVLPEAGGLLDQDPEWIYKIQTLIRARNLKQEIEERKKRGSRPT